MSFTYPLNHLYSNPKIFFSLDETLACIRYPVDLEKTFKPNFPLCSECSDHE